MMIRPPERARVLEESTRSEGGWPRTYRVVVEGGFDPNWPEMLAGMELMPGSGDQPADVTVLVGSIIDEAELSGVLNALYDFQLSLLSVEVIKGDAESEERPENKGAASLATGNHPC